MILPPPLPELEGLEYLSPEQKRRLSPEALADYEERCAKAWRALGAWTDAAYEALKRGVFTPM